MRGRLLRRAVPWAVRAASGAVRAAIGALRRAVCRGGEVRAGPVVRGVRCWALGALGVPWCGTGPGGALGVLGAVMGPGAACSGGERPAVGRCAAGRRGAAGGRRGRWSPWTAGGCRWGCRGAVCRVIHGAQWFVTDCYGTACSRVADTPGGVYRWGRQVEGDPNREDPDTQNGRTETPG